MMVALTGVVAFAASIYSTSRWDRAGVHFHPLLQLQLMGLNGAFLTGDLFNLFVFFEVMLAASYGLLLHGSGRLRVQAGLHYVAINLAASSLFLIGAALLYGVTGTLNMADLGVRIAQLAPADRGLVHAAAAILATAFFAKAGAWPLNFWLVPAYSAAVSPVGAVFALLTKLGIYTVLRLWTAALRARHRRLGRSSARACWSRSGSPRCSSARSASSARSGCRTSPASACWCRPARCWRPSGSASRPCGPARSTTC